MTSVDARGMRTSCDPIARVQHRGEALFDIKAAVYDIRDVLIEPPEDDDEETEEDT